MLHGVDLSKFKVIYDEKVLRAVAIADIRFLENADFSSRRTQAVWEQYVLSA